MSSKRCTSDIGYIGPKERQDVIYETIYRCGFATVGSFAYRFAVSEKTIRRDVSMLMRSYPIEITRGRNAVIRVSEGHKLTAPIYSLLTAKEKQYLKGLAEIVPDEGLPILMGILAKVAS